MCDDPEFCPLCGTAPCLAIDDDSHDEVFVRDPDATDDQNNAAEHASLDRYYERRLAEIATERRRAATNPS